MKLELNLNFGKQSIAQPATPPAAPEPTPVVPVAKVDSQVRPEAVTTLLEMAKAMPPMIQQAQAAGQIAAINGGETYWGPVINWQVLRTLADQADLIRMAIQSVKKSIRAQDWNIAAPDGIAVNPGAEKLLNLPDGANDWDTWASMILEEILVCDNLCLFPWWLGGRVTKADVLDGDTVTPKPGLDGRLPIPPESAFEQCVPMGMKRFTTEQLWYLPQNRRAKTIRGYSPTEQLLGRATVNLWKVLKDLSRWTRGGVPPALIMVEGMMADQGEAWQKVLANRVKDPAFESTLQVVPGSKSLVFPAIRIDKEHEEILIRAIFYCFGVDPTGMVSQVNYSTANALERWASLQGMYPYLYALQSIAGKLLANAGFVGHRLEWKVKRDAEALAQKQAKRDDYKAGLLSWEDMREGDGESIEAADIKDKHFFVEGLLNPFDPLAKKAQEPKASPWPFLPASQQPGEKPEEGQVPAPKVSVDPEARKAEVGRWQTVVRKAVAKGASAKPFRSSILSKAFRFRVERALSGGAGLGAFSKAKPDASEVKTWETSKRGQKATEAIAEAIAPYLLQVVTAAKQEALSAFKSVQKAEAFSEGWAEAPTQETWRAFLAALKAAVEAGVDDAADLTGYGAIGDAALAYAKARAGLLLGRTWDESLGVWVDQADTSKFYLPDTIRDIANQSVSEAIEGGWGVADLTAKLDEVLESHSRSLMVARTETAEAYNTGAASNYAAQGVEVVEVLDGGEGFNCECADVNGQIWTIAVALQRPTGHPNCTRAFLPRADLSASDADEG